MSTSMNSIISAMRGLVSLKESPFHEELDAASAQHDAERKELDQLRADYDGLKAALAERQVIDLYPLKAEIAALKAELEATKKDLGAVENDVDLLLDLAQKAEHEPIEEEPEPHVPAPGGTGLEGGAPGVPSADKAEPQFGSQRGSFEDAMRTNKAEPAAPAPKVSPPVALNPPAPAPIIPPTTAT